MEKIPPITLSCYGFMDSKRRWSPYSQLYLILNVRARDLAVKTALGS